MYYEDLLENVVNMKDDISVDFKLGKEGLKRTEKHYEKYSLPFNDTWNDGKYYKYITIENYGSGGHGSYVRNAVTGTVCKEFIRVGSSDEDLYFKVTDSSGRNGRNYPLMLYYDSPEQYENHHFTSISPEVKRNWLQRSSAVQKRL